MKKYGLVSPYRDKHAAKGGIECERLEVLVEAGMTIGTGLLPLQTLSD